MKLQITTTPYRYEVLSGYSFFDVHHEKVHLNYGDIYYACRVVEVPHNYATYMVFNKVNCIVFNNPDVVKECLVSMSTNELWKDEVNGFNDNHTDTRIIYE